MSRRRRTSTGRPWWHRKSAPKIGCETSATLNFQQSVFVPSFSDLSSFFWELNFITSYHPQANGMVERFHRDLKAALRSRLNGPNWVDELLWVLLGLRTASKEDIHTSAAEMVYGTPLTVPGDFVCPSDDPVAAAGLLSNLRDEVLKLRPTPVLRHGTAVSRVPNNIMSTDYVFVRHDAHCGPLHRIYDGPYHVVERADKTFVLDIGGRIETVSIDRLKCAHADPVRPIVPAKPPRRGRPRIRQTPQAQADQGRPIVPAKPRRRGRPPRVGQSSSTFHCCGVTRWGAAVWR